MAKSKATFSKREREKKRLKKRQDKQVKKEERKANSDGGGLENMLAYVDEFGNITDTPPDPTRKRKKIKAEDIVIGVPKRDDEEEMDSVLTGKIEYYNTDKGFGFIRELETQEKYFFHVKGLIDPVAERDTVSFELEQGFKGLNAVRVSKV